MNLANNKDSEVVLSKGDILFQEGEVVEFVYVLKRGLLLSVTKSGERIVPIFSVKDQGVLGEDCAFKGDKYFYSSIAMESSVLVKIPKQDITKFLNSSSDWLNKVLLDMSEKLNSTKTIISEHRIFSDKLMSGIDFTNELEAQIRKKLN